MNNSQRYASTVSVPLLNTSTKENETDYFVFDVSDLPSVEDAILILTSENASIELWHRIALLYYHSGNDIAFITIAETCYENVAATNSVDDADSLVSLLLSIGDYHTQKVYRLEVDKPETAKAHLARGEYAYKLVNRLTTGTHSNYEFYVQYVVSQAYVHLFQRDVEKADAKFSVIMNNNEMNSRDNILVILGKAFSAFAKKNYSGALYHFKRVLEKDPLCPANVRVGIGHCLWKLNFKKKAKLAYERAVEVFPYDPNAICALAVCFLNDDTRTSVETGVNLLRRAYSISDRHPMTLLLLADHFFNRKEYQTAMDLAKRAYAASGNIAEATRRSAFIIGRTYEALNQSKFAMHYYYDALREPNDNFFLPCFGLAQSYLHCNDIQRSSAMLKKLLLRDRGSTFVKRMLGCLLSNSSVKDERIKAQSYLKSILDQNSTDIICRIALATSQELLDDVQAEKNYCLAIEESEKRDEIVMPEVYNNLGCTLFRLRKFDDAIKNFELALEMSSDIHEVLGTEVDFRPLNIVILFNYARTKEASFEFGKAEQIYKNILREHPSYSSCFVRLGIIAREKGNLHDADNYFKQALQFSQHHPDVWTLMGNLHLAQNGLDPAFKKFNKIRNLNEDMKNDSYTLIALGNLELIMAQRYCFGDELKFSQFRFEQHLFKAMQLYQQVILKEPANIWAAHGVGCVLACKGEFASAREVFSEVLEANPDFRDVHLNVAHTYLEQEMYKHAIQVYERSKKCEQDGGSWEVLQYIAKAHFMNNSYAEARSVLLKARRIAPYNITILFQLGKTIRKVGWQLFQNQSNTNNFDTYLHAQKQIKLAQKLFVNIGKSETSSVSLRNAAGVESAHCEELIKRFPHMLHHLETTLERRQELESELNQKVMDYRTNQMKERDLLIEAKKLKEQDAKKQRDEISVVANKVKQSLETEKTILERRKGKKQKSAKCDILCESTNDERDKEKDTHHDDSVAASNSKKKKRGVARKRKDPVKAMSENTAVPVRRSRRKRIICRRESDSDEDQIQNLEYNKEEAGNETVDDGSITNELGIIISWKRRRIEDPEDNEWDSVLHGTPSTMDQSGLLVKSVLEKDYDSSSPPKLSPIRQPSPYDSDVDYPPPILHRWDSDNE